MSLSSVARDGTLRAALVQRAPWLATASRYGISTAGPLAVSGAHFLASLIFLRHLPATEFGLFAFVMVVVAFGMSLNGSLIVVPLTQHLVHGDSKTRPTCFKMNLLLCAAFAIALAIALLASHAPLPEAAMLGVYGGVFAFRWSGRNHAYIEGRIGAAILSDLTYSLLLIWSLGMLVLTHHVSFTAGSEMLMCAALASLIPFGPRFFLAQFAALRDGRLRDYLPIFRDLTRWSLAGVALTEMTVNAHAYLVTFIAGPGAFALPALGMLLMRPAALVQTALPDMERPAMARAIAAKDYSHLARIRRQFTFGLSGAWLLTIAVTAALLLLAPQFILKKGYSLNDVALVVAICAVIMAVRTFRTPLAVQLQAAGQFKNLARIGMISGAMSVAAVLALLLAFGPIASLGGILLGDLVILARVHVMVRRWRAQYG